MISKWVFLAVIPFVSGSALAVDPYPITYPYTYTNLFPAVYDIDGKMGVVVGTEVQNDPDYNYTNEFDGPMPLFRVGETTPFLIGTDEILFNNAGYGLAAGDPFYFRMETRVGTVSGTSKVGAAFVYADFPERTAQPIVFIPFSSTALGKDVKPMFRRLQDNEFPGSRFIQLNQSAYLADSLTEPSVGTGPEVTAGFQDRQLTIQFDWLAGNEKFGDPPYLFSGAVGTGYNGEVWTNDEDSSPSMHPFVFPGPVPEGPIRATYHVDGFTTDTVTFTASNRTVHQINFLLISDPSSTDPGPTPEQIGSPITLEQRSAADAILFRARAMKGVPEDANADGVKDAADAIRVLLVK